MHINSFAISKNNLVIAWVVTSSLLLIAVLFYVLHNSQTPTETGGVVITDMEAPKKSYYEDASQVSVSQEEIWLREKMKERWQIQEFKIGFNSRGFIASENINLKSATMTQFELDTSNADLPAGSILSLSIPSANLDSQITIPGRYRFLVTFQKNGPQKIVLKWKGLSGWEIDKIIHLQ